MITEVVAGTNRFVDCDNIFTMKGRPLLRIQTDPLRVSLTTASDDARFKHVEVQDNESKAEGRVRVDTTDSSVSAFYDEQLVVSAIQTGEGRVIVTIDLRPLGLTVFTEASSLVVGSARFESNSFAGGTGINLG